MKKITILTNEVSINGNYYPFNKIYFKKDNDNVIIYTIGGDQLYNDHYSLFMNSSNTPYTSAQAVIDALTQSFA